MTLPTDIKRLETAMFHRLAEVRLFNDRDLSRPARFALLSGKLGHRRIARLFKDASRLEILNRLDWVVITYPGYYQRFNLFLGRERYFWDFIIGSVQRRLQAEQSGGLKPINRTKP